MTENATRDDTQDAADVHPLLSDDAGLAARYSEADRVMTLLIRTIDLARDVALGWLDDHGEGCSCPYCGWHARAVEDLRDEVETVARVLRWADSMTQCCGELASASDRDGTPADRYARLARLAEDAW